MTSQLQTHLLTREQVIPSLHLPHCYWKLLCTDTSLPATTWHLTPLLMPIRLHYNHVSKTTFLSTTGFSSFAILQQLVPLEPALTTGSAKESPVNTNEKG